jgi:hypothetical protein
MAKVINDKDLLGAWSMESWSHVYDDGRPEDFPLGPGALGVLTYTPDGRMSTVVSRGGRSETAPSSIEEKAAAFEDTFTYAGSFEVREGVVHHLIDIAHDPSLLGNTVLRYGEIEGDHLIYKGAGSDFWDGAKRHQRVVWRRFKR